MTTLSGAIETTIATPFQALNDRATHWASREWVGQKLDRVGSALNQKWTSHTHHAEVIPSNLQKLFHMEQVTLPSILDLKKPNNYKRIVKRNFGDLALNMKSNRILDGYQLRSLPKQLLIDDHIKPIKELAKGNANYLGSGLTRMAGLGLIAFDVAQDTKEAYQDEGTTEAFKTAGKSTLKNAVSWQAASIGYLFGKASLPALGKLPLGGIITGTISAMLAGYVLDKLID